MQLPQDLNPPTRRNWSNGVYFSYEAGQPSTHGGGPGGPRIVRVGTHREQDRLLLRLGYHWNGPNGNSVLRRHIQGALANLLPQPRLPTVGGYIQTSLSFVRIMIPLPADRRHFETILISTINQCPVCGPARPWLGASANNPKIANGKLWNVQALNGPMINQAELARLQAFATSTPPGP